MENCVSSPSKALDNITALLSLWRDCGIDHTARLVLFKVVPGMLPQASMSAARREDHCGAIENDGLPPTGKSESENELHGQRHHASAAGAVDAGAGTESAGDEPETAASAIEGGAAGVAARRIRI